MSLLLSNQAEIIDNTLLFCLDKNEPLLNLEGQLDNRLTGNLELDSYLSSLSTDYIIDRWLMAATSSDHSEDIYLDHIYRIVFNNKTFSLKWIYCR